MPLAIRNICNIFGRLHPLCAYANASMFWAKCSRCHGGRTAQNGSKRHSYLTYAHQTVEHMTCGACLHETYQSHNSKWLGPTSKIKVALLQATQCLRCQGGQAQIYRENSPPGTRGLEPESWSMYEKQEYMGLQHFHIVCAGACIRETWSDATPTITHQWGKLLPFVSRHVRCSVSCALHFCVHNRNNTGVRARIRSHGAK